jgi:replication-associated recombination protein RarA
MSDIKQNLFWEKYRPQTLEEMALPERILKFVSNGVQTNMIFTGTAGMGKTTLARILTKNVPNLPLSAKLGVEVLRNDIKTFCTQVFPFEDNNAMRVVYFEEFDRASPQLQEELKSFIEQYSHRVRFIATTNTTSGFDKNLLSRFNVIDFTPIDNAETKHRINQYYQRIKQVVVQDGIDIKVDDLKTIIRKSYPDFRSIWQQVQYYVLSGGVMSGNTKAVDNIQLFELAVDAHSPVDTWDYLDTNWRDRVNVAFEELGRNFFQWVRTTHPDKEKHLPQTIVTLSEFSDVRLPHAMDEFVTLCALMYKYQQIFKG